jgi:flavorubredoxin
LFEETCGALFSSDLFHQNGDVEAIRSFDIVGRFKEVLIEYQKVPFANYLPYTTNTDKILNRLANLKPKLIASMHGSTYIGDDDSAVYDLAQAMKDVLAAAG